MALWVRAKKLGPVKPTPNPYPSRFNRWRHKVSTSFILILMVAIFLRFYPPVFTLIQQQLFEYVTVIQTYFNHPTQLSKTLIEDSFSFLTLRDEYDRLKKENEALKWQIQTLIPFQHENAALRSAMNIGEFETFRHIAIPVLATPYDGNHHFCIIKGGEKEQLKSGQAVVVPEGVVGRVEKVGRYSSRVTLLNDINSRIPVRTVNSEQNAILAGDESTLPILVYITDSRKVQIGESVVTSGSGGVFPPGVPVGIIDKIYNGKISIRPYVNLSNLEWISILNGQSEDYFEDLTSSLEGE